MVSKYSDIQAFIDAQSYSFEKYLRNTLLYDELWYYLKRISTRTDVYIFSGVIRNFFLNDFNNRDIDIVIRNIRYITLSNLKLLVSIDKNRFGGLRISLDKLKIDAWELDETWGIIEENKNASPEELITTAFFNFSAIVYDVKDSCFIYGDDFCRFLQTKTMDVVYPKNPDITLCIINTLYYKHKYKLSLSRNLCRWIVSHYHSDLNFRATQLRHFGRIIYSNREIASFVSFCHLRI